MNVQDILFILVNILPILFLIFIIIKVYTSEESENPEELDIAIIDADVIVHIKDDLFYDPNTFIVYRNIELLNKNDAILVHYYSPAGYEYRYNPETNKFEEIKESETE